MDMNQNMMLHNLETVLAQNSEEGSIMEEKNQDISDQEQQIDPEQINSHLFASGAYQSGAFAPFGWQIAGGGGDGLSMTPNPQNSFTSPTAYQQITAVNPVFFTNYAQMTQQPYNGNTTTMMIPNSSPQFLPAQTIQASQVAAAAATNVRFVETDHPIKVVNLLIKGSRHSRKNENHGSQFTLFPDELYSQPYKYYVKMKFDFEHFKEKTSKQHQLTATPLPNALEMENLFKETIKNLYLEFKLVVEKGATNEVQWEEKTKGINICEKGRLCEDEQHQNTEDKHCLLFLIQFNELSWKNHRKPFKLQVWQRLNPDVNQSPESTPLPSQTLPNQGIISILPTSNTSSSDLNKNLNNFQQDLNAPFITQQQQQQMISQSHSQFISTSNVGPTNQFMPTKHDTKQSNMDALQRYENALLEESNGSNNNFQNINNTNNMNTNNLNQIHNTNSMNNLINSIQNNMLTAQLEEESNEIQESLKNDMLLMNIQPTDDDMMNQDMSISMSSNGMSIDTSPSKADVSLSDLGLSFDNQSLILADQNDNSDTSSEPSRKKRRIFKNVDVQTPKKQSTNGNIQRAHEIDHKNLIITENNTKTPDAQQQQQQSFINVASLQQHPVYDVTNLQQQQQQQQIPQFDVSALPQPHLIPLFQPPDFAAGGVVLLFQTQAFMLYARRKNKEKGMDGPIPTTPVVVSSKKSSNNNNNNNGSSSSGIMSITAPAPGMQVPFNGATYNENFMNMANMANMSHVLNMNSLAKSTSGGMGRGNMPSGAPGNGDSSSSVQTPAFISLLSQNQVNSGPTTYVFQPQTQQQQQQSAQQHQIPQTQMQLSHTSNQTDDEDRLSFQQTQVPMFISQNQGIQLGNVGGMSMNDFSLRGGAGGGGEENQSLNLPGSDMQTQIPNAGGAFQNIPVDQNGMFNFAKPTGPIIWYYSESVPFQPNHQ